MRARRAPRPRQTGRFEQLIALVRLGVVVTGAVLVAVGADAAQTYPLLGWATVAVASAYAAATTLRPHSLAPITSSAIDSALTLSLTAATGGARSPGLAILLLVVIAAAMRFDLKVSLLVAGLAAFAMSAVVLAVPEPTLPLAVRVQTAAWWAVMLGFGAALSGALARVEREERDRLAEAQAQAQALATLDHERREFLRVVAHELRTPATSLRALARRVMADSEELDSRERAEALTLIAGHADHLLVFGDVLREVAGASDLASVDRPNFDEIVVGDVVRAATASAVAAADAGCDAVVVTGTDGVARTDAQRLRRIVTNLVDNALRHHEGEAPVEVAIEVTQRHYGISVADRGPGMGEEELALAFERYASFGHRRGSSGLGLWIVNELARSLGGTVEARSRLGGGLVVSVVVPTPDPADNDSEPQ